MFELTERQNKLLEFVKEHHGDQKRNYTGEPYWTHPLAVAEIVSKIDTPISSNGYLLKPVYVEIALCHDLFEDTKCTIHDLVYFLRHNGYDNPGEKNIICDGTRHLTDQYTKERHPDMNRAMRKTMEIARLRSSPAYAQTVKYADLIHNTSSIVANDPNFAIVYLREKRKLIRVIRSGDPDLYIQCCHTLVEAEKALGITAQPDDIEQLFVNNNWR